MEERLTVNQETMAVGEHRSEWSTCVWSSSAMDDGGRWLVVSRRRRVVAGEQQAGKWRPRWFLM
ncbi:hypothetical protein Dimus_027471, partial [Dionaea muscipula]